MTGGGSAKTSNRSEKFELFRERERERVPTTDLNDSVAVGVGGRDVGSGRPLPL